jgi:predicted kinase
VINKATFTKKNGAVVLLCSECGKTIKTQKEFNTIERYAYNRVTSLGSQYCDEHSYVNMSSKDRKEEMSKRSIKEKLREAMTKNVIGVKITRPNQELIIMRGIPGAGKSTEAERLLGEGMIHSTDTLIEETTGDYNGYFTKMVESGDWSELGKMHHRNFLKAKMSMEQGVSPVIVDNTNIKASEPKKYVEAALKLGLSEDNIKIVDVGNGGQTADILAERNTHNVPLKTIQRMMSSHKGVGKLSVKKILEAKGGLKEESRVLYAAVVLDKESQSSLLSQFASKLPEGWENIAHHMTIVFGRGLDDKNEIGKEVELTVTELGISDVAMAVKVEGYPSANDIPHITVAVNEAGGGKPFMSNKITNWDKVDLGYKLKLYGIVTEIKT